MSPTLQRKMKLPLHFVSFAFTEGKLIRHYRSTDTFTDINGRRAWGSRVVYGGLFHLEDYNFHIRQIDAYHQCSQSTIGNHDFDLHHRIKRDVTTISLPTIEDLQHLRYWEKSHQEADIYIGNMKHPKIKSRFKENKHTYRVNSGVVWDAFLSLHKEVT